MKNNIGLVIVALLMFGCATALTCQKYDRTLIEEVCGPVQWPSVPISVYASTQLGDDETGLVIEAINWWNEQLGIRLLQYVGRIATDETVETVTNNFAIYVFPGKLVDHGLFHWEVDVNCYFVKGVVVLPSYSKPQVLRAIVRHELGHALGLGHDDKTRSSVMHPVVTSENLEGVVMVGDRATLGGLYAPRN